MNPGTNIFQFAQPLPAVTKEPLVDERGLVVPAREKVNILGWCTPSGELAAEVSARKRQPPKLSVRQDGLDGFRGQELIKMLEATKKFVCGDQQTKIDEEIAGIRKRFNIQDPESNEQAQPEKLN